MAKKATKKTFKPGKNIVASGSKGFRKKLKKSVDDGIKELTINLEGVEMVDSVGLGVLIATHNSLNSAGGQLKVTNASEDIFKLLKTMRLDQHFEVSAAK